MMVRSIVNEAYEYMSFIFEKDAANKWADGFMFPKDIHERDEQLFNMSQENFAVMIHGIQESQRSDRFSVERVRDVVPIDDPDYQYLLQLAEGMAVVILPSFQCQTEPRPLRALYKELAAPINKLFYKQWEAGRAVIMRSTIASTIEGIHYTPVHWTPSRDKAEGRPLYDLSDSKGGHALNSDELREWGKVNIGRICNPSIRELIVMIWEFVRSEQQRDSSLTWNDFTLGKMDLKSAFNLLNFRPADVRLLAAALTDELTIFSLVGVFGYTLLPAYFDHIPKVLLRLLRPRIRAAADMFVDDFMAITIKQEWPTVAAEVRTVCESLLGSKAISSDKTRQGAVLDFIGWEIDLPQQRVSIAHHCFLKAVYLYFEVDVDHPVPLRQMQQLGSLASRYSEVCTVMRPYTAALWHCTRGITNPSTRCKLTPMAKRAIWLWRCMLCLHKWDRYAFSRSIESFIVPLCPRFRCCFDASLRGMGAVIWEHRGTETVLWGILREQFPSDFNFDKSDYQNIAEFMTVVAMILMLVEEGVRNCGIVLVGDSKVALHWAGSQKFSGADRNNPTSLLFTLLSAQFGIQVVGTEWLSSESNAICDGLSRMEDMTRFGHLYINRDNYREWKYGDVKYQLLGLCNPRRHDDGTLACFLSLWHAIQDRLVLWSQ